MSEQKIVRGLSGKEFGKILEIIKKDHKLIDGLCVKYVDSSFDFRTMTFWRIVLRPFGIPIEFSTANRAIGDTQTKKDYDSLYEEVTEFLNHYLFIKREEASKFLNNKNKGELT